MQYRPPMEAVFSQIGTFVPMIDNLVYIAPCGTLVMRQGKRVHKIVGFGLYPTGIGIPNELTALEVVKILQYFSIDS